MKLYIIIGISFIVYFYGCTKSNPTENKILSPLDYNVYNRYSYCGPSSKYDTTFYYYTTTKNSFDSLFYFVGDHNIPDSIPLADYSDKKVLSIVKYGNNFYVLSVKELSLSNGILSVAYSDSLIAANMTWTAAIPIIITTEVNFQRVIFIENGTPVKEINP